jgi:hypothetical protein
MPYDIAERVLVSLKTSRASGPEAIIALRRRNFARWMRMSFAGYSLALTLGGCLPPSHRVLQNPASSSSVAAPEEGKTADRLLIVGLVLLAVGIILLLPRIDDPNY